MKALGSSPTRIVFRDRRGVELIDVDAREIRSCSWERVESDTSQASVSVQSLDRRFTEQLEPWLHEVRMYRSERLAWQGPVFTTASKSGNVTIVARDGSAYFDRRRIAQRRSYQQIDASIIAAELIEDAMAIDDPFYIAQRMKVALSGIPVTMSEPAEERMLSEVLKDLVDAGLTWTVYAGRLVIGPAGREIVTSTLGDRDISGSFTITKDGSATATDIQVLGKGATGRFVRGTEDLGVLQKSVKADAITREYAANNKARALVKDSYPTPRRVTLDGATRLLPAAPITVDELIVGVIVPIKSEESGLSINARMQLKSVEASITAESDEYKVTLVDEPKPLEPDELQPPPHGYFEEKKDQEGGI